MINYKDLRKLSIDEQNEILAEEFTSDFGVPTVDDFETGDLVVCPFCDEILNSRAFDTLEAHKHYFTSDGLLYELTARDMGPFVEEALDSAEAEYEKEYELPDTVTEISGAGFEASMTVAALEQVAEEDPEFIAIYHQHFDENLNNQSWTDYWARDPKESTAKLVKAMYQYMVKEF